MHLNMLKTYPSSKVVPVLCSPEAWCASFVRRPGAKVSSGLKDKLKSVENGSLSLGVPALRPLQLGRTHVNVDEDLSSLK